MKKYDNPEMEVITFHSEDILIASGALSGSEGGYLDGDDEDFDF